jgi:hypothetical protein
LLDTVRGCRSVGKVQLNSYAGLHLHRLCRSPRQRKRAVERPRGQRGRGYFPFAPPCATQRPGSGAAHNTATALMLAPGISVSSTSCCLSAQLQRRQRSTIITSARCIVLDVRLSLPLEPSHPRRRGSRRPHRAVTQKASRPFLKCEPLHTLRVDIELKIDGSLRRHRSA